MCYTWFWHLLHLIGLIGYGKYQGILKTLHDEMTKDFAVAHNCGGSALGAEKTLETFSYGTNDSDQHDYPPITGMGKPVYHLQKARHHMPPRG